MKTEGTYTVTVQYGTKIVQQLHHLNLEDLATVVDPPTTSRRR